MKKTFLLIFCASLLLTKSAKAVYDPLSVANNRFGIHVADPNDISEVVKLVNSTGGDWGYVTLVIQENDRYQDKWQEIFNKMRRFHLIPLVRLATKVEGDYWLKPEKENLNQWVSFLSKLNWPIKNRYVIVFNEPNHAKEWGNELDPDGYAETLTTLAKLLKESSEDFFVLPAGLDVSAISDGKAMDAAVFLRRMVEVKPEILNLIDGWTSHSYPNPAFSSSPIKQGRGSLYSYQWELSFLQSLGLKKNLPIFITETGWQHSEGKDSKDQLLAPERVGENLKIAADNAWRDSRIVAVTPFVFNYQDIPFDHFSWKVLGAATYYPHYFAYQEVEKTKGTPRQEQKYKVSGEILPSSLIASSKYKLSVEIENIGQAILDSDDFYTLILKTESFSLERISLPRIEPGEKGELSFEIKTPAERGNYPLSLQIKHFDEQIVLEEQEIEIISPPGLKIRTPLGFRKKAESEGVVLTIFDQEKKIKELKDLKIKEGILYLSELTNIVPDKEYKIKIKIPFYLPRETKVFLDSKKQELEIVMSRFLPFDFNQDGRFTLNDLKAVFKLKIINFFSLFF